MKELPILLLTGYLGSGKTTLLNRILSNRKGIRFAVIVNDIGELNIDASLIAKDGVVGMKDDSLVALQNGCICCTLKMDLVEQIGNIASSGKFDYLVIEASGICEPEPIARTISSIPQVAPHIHAESPVRLDSVVTVVDVLRMRDEFACAKDLLRGNFDEDDIENLVIQQIEFCNMVLLNKASEVSAEDLGKVREIVRAIQPKASIIECDYGDVDFDRLLDTNAFDYDSVASSAAWISEVEGHHEDHEHHHDHDEDEGETEEYGISTCLFESRRPFDINKFDNFVARHWPAGIIRVKGICYFTDDTDVCYLFEQAGHQISMKNAGQWYATMPREQLLDMLQTDPMLARDWDPEYGDRMIRLVFIGQHLDKDSIKGQLDLCLA